MAKPSLSISRSKRPSYGRAHWTSPNATICSLFNRAAKRGTVQPTLPLLPRSGQNSPVIGCLATDECTERPAIERAIGEHSARIDSELLKPYYKRAKSHFDKLVKQGDSYAETLHRASI